jgi:hypothetical protein
MYFLYQVKQGERLPFACAAEPMTGRLQNGTNAAYCSESLNDHLPFGSFCFGDSSQLTHTLKEIVLAFLREH